MRVGIAIAALVSWLHGSSLSLAQIDYLSQQRSVSAGSYGQSAADFGPFDVSVQGNYVRFGPVDLPESAELRLHRLYPKSLVKEAVHTILVPKPMTARVGGKPLRDKAVLQWASDLIRAVLLGSVSDAARVGTRQDTVAARTSR